MNYDPIKEILESLFLGLNCEIITSSVPGSPWMEAILGFKISLENVVHSHKASQFEVEKLLKEDTNRRADGRVTIGNLVHFLNNGPHALKLQAKIAELEEQVGANLCGAKNGWALKINEELITFQETGDEVDNFAEFLGQIRDSCGFAGSRYDKDRIYITIGPGDKYETIFCPFEAYTAEADAWNDGHEAYQEQPKGENPFFGEEGSERLKTAWDWGFQDAASDARRKNK